MKTIAFLGSPNKEGNTAKALNEVIRELDGEVEVVYIFDHLDVKPCCDCMYCHKNPGCIYKDYFSSLLERIEQADCFIVASPMWFTSLSGPMMSFFSRLQTVTSGHIYRKDRKHTFSNAGIFIMSSGSKYHSMSKAMETTAEFVFSHFDAIVLSQVYVHKTDELKTLESHYDSNMCKHAAKVVNAWYQDKLAGRFYKYGYTSENYIRLIDRRE